MTFYQRFLFFIVRLPMLVIWVFDNFLVEPVVKFLKGLTIGTIGAFDLAFISIVIYFVYSGFFASVSNGMIQSQHYYRSYGGSGEVLGSGIQDFPRLINEIPKPDVSADIVLVMDANTDKVLYEKNSTTRHPPASTTKLMTALVSDELYDLDEIIAVSGECTLVASTKAFLPTGSEYYVSDLLKALLISSAGDAACILSSSKVEYINFIDRMNSLAQELGMQDTHFTNPVGLDDPNGNHYSTAHDLFLLAKSSMKKKFITEAVSTEHTSVYSIDKSLSANLVNTNDLLSNIPQTYGIKTGTTEAAGEVLIYGYRKDLVDIIIIVMGSDSRFEETENLLNWTLASYSWES